MRFGRGEVGLGLSVLVGVVWLSGCFRAGFDHADGGQRPDDARQLDVDPLDQRPPGVDRAQDATADQAAPVLDGPTADVGLTDIGLTDTGGAGPCAGGASLLDEIGTMAVCQGNAVTQCQAGQHCNAQAGYAVCKASQYRLLYANAPPPSTFFPAWVAGCLHGDTSSVPAHAPSDSACPSCVQKMVAPGFPYEWTCSGATGGSSLLDYMGVVSASDCHRLGINSVATAAYWNGLLSKSASSKVLCCK